MSSTPSFDQPAPRDAEALASFALLRLLTRHLLHHSMLRREEIANDLALLCEREEALGAAPGDPVHGEAAALLREVLREIGS